MSNKIHQLGNRIERLKGERKQILTSVQSARKKLRSSKITLKNLEEAREILRVVGLKTQEQLQYHISDITTIALDAVFDEPYSLEIEFVQRRNKTECDISFRRGENKIHPLQASGGGAVDVAAFALRIALWTLTSSLRNTIILDEPMRFISEDLREKASLMIKEVSTRLDIQFIIITHEPALTAYSDKIHRVTIKNKISTVKSYMNNNINSF